MCGRTSLYVDPAELEAAFDATIAFDYRPRYNIAPRDDLAVISNADVEAIDQQEWGLVAPWADASDDGPRPINARAETVDEKPMLETAFHERRCLVLADGFYEWQEPEGRGTKQPYRIHLAENDPFAIAGVWNRHEFDGREHESVAIITTEANEIVAPIHDRMPVILERGQERDWLHAEPDAAKQHLRPYTGADLQTYPISTRVNDPSFDDPQVLVEESAPEQRGLDEFGS